MVCGSGIEVEAVFWSQFQEELVLRRKDVVRVGLDDVEDAYGVVIRLCDAVGGIHASRAAHDS